MSIINIDTYLSQLNGKEIIFYPFSGNAGDALISLAAYQKFMKHNISYKIFTPETVITSESILVFNGGGHLYEKYHNSSVLIEQYKDICRIIVLPQSASGHKELFTSLSNNIDIICREEVSYSYLNRIQCGANIFIADDLALSLDVYELLEESTILKEKSSILSLKRRFKSRLKLEKKKYLYKRANAKSKNPLPANELNVFRQDDESTKTHESKISLDLSLLFAYRPKQLTLPHSELATVELLRFINDYDIINTDRLHICISGLLLGKNVNFYPNNYYKNESIYSYSLKKRFADILNWCGENE